MRSDKKARTKKKLSKFFVKLITTVAVLIAVVLAALTVLEYKPLDSEIITIAGTSSAHPSMNDTIKIVTWNIGYAALGDDATYFADGGKDVRTADEARVEENLAAISRYLNEEKPDITLLQEVDRSSQRSHGINESHYILSNTEGAYTATFATNHKMLFIPYPIPPIGKVDSGLLTTSVYDINFSSRIAIPSPFGWPKKTISLKRCLMVDRMPINGTDKDLIVINLHLEPYTDEKTHELQMKTIMDIMSEEYQKGNYVVAGGDFNNTFSSVNLDKFPQDPKVWAPSVIDTAELGENWNVLMDSSVPSCRLLNKPFAGADPETFQFYVIDGFVVSKNIKVQSLKTTQLNFANSDHNPVVLELTLGN